MRQHEHVGITLAAVQNPIAERLPYANETGRRVLIVDHDENALIALKRLLDEAMCDTPRLKAG